MKMWKNALRVTSNAARDDAFWAPGDVTARLTVTTTVTRRTVVVKRELFGNVHLISNV